MLAHAQIGAQTESQPSKCFPFGRGRHDFLDVFGHYYFFFLVCVQFILLTRSLWSRVDSEADSPTTVCRLSYILHIPFLFGGLLLYPLLKLDCFPPHQVHKQRCFLRCFLTSPSANDSPGFASSISGSLSRRRQSGLLREVVAEPMWKARGSAREPFVS